MLISSARVFCIISSRIFPFSRAEEFAGIQKLFPRADLKFIPDSGHWPHAEKPLEFAQTVTEFLDECLQDHNEFQDEN